MIRGIRAAASAMSTQLARQEVLAQNVANFSTAGYKQEFAPVEGLAANVNRVDRDSKSGFSYVAQRLPQVGSMGTSIAVSEVSVDFRQGIVSETHRPLDVALEGDGFLEVLTPEGYFYSRGGALHLDAESHLVTDEGYFVLDSNGEPLTLGEGDLQVGRDGTISLDGEAVAQLSVVEFEPGTMLVKAGLGLYTVQNPDTAQPMVAMETVVRQGFLEESNVDQASAMAELMTGLRAYQASQRMMLAQDELLGRAVNEVGHL